MPKLEIPVIGIGAGPATDGQVLVFHDLLGIYAGHKPKFVKRYADVRGGVAEGVRAYTEEVRARPLPRRGASTPTRSRRRSSRSSPATSSRRASAGTDTPWDW